jgi:hypothetical protein
MKTSSSLAKLGKSVALTAVVTLSSPLTAANAQTANFVAANSAAISGEVSELSHVIMVQIPRPLILDIGAGERTTLTVPTLSDIIINGQKVAPAQTPVLISVEPADGKKGARVKAKGIMLQGKLIALDADGDFIPSVVVNKKEFNERVKAAMNLGAVIGNGLAGTAGANLLGMIGKSIGDPTGTNIANQMTSAGGLLGIMSGMFSGGGGRRIIDLQPNSIHVLTVKNPAMIVAQMIQMQREIAGGNNQVIGAITNRIQSGTQLAPKVVTGTAVAQQPRRQAATTPIQQQASVQRQTVAQAAPLF